VTGNKERRFPNRRLRVRGLESRLSFWLAIVNRLSPPRRAVGLIAAAWRSLD